MASLKFHVGQRVRIIWKKERRDNADVSEGDVAVIVKLGPRGLDGSYCDCADCTVRVRGRDYFAFFCHLAPAADDRNKVIAWADCLWQPNETA